MRRALDEYEVGGIKTTLPFFREIVRDEEFKQGRLDTGFIARFNERRETALPAEKDQERQDMAIIAAALRYAALRKQASAGRPAEPLPANRWKMSGRNEILSRGFTRISADQKKNKGG